MLKRLSHAVLMLSVLLLGLLGATGHASAQQSSADSLQLKDLKGIDTAYQRTYTVDMAAMMATPSAQPGQMNGLFAINALVAKFNSSDDAGPALDKLSGEIEQVMSKGDASVKLEKEDLSGVGDKAYGYAGSIEQEGMKGQVYMALAQKDKYLHLVIGIGLGDANPKDDIVSFVKKMIEAKEGTDGITTNGQGFKTGGMYDKLPLTGVPGNLTPDKGAEVYPKDETGAASGAATVTAPGPAATPPGS